METVKLNGGQGFEGREVGKMPWRKKWQPAPGSLPGKPHGQRSLVAYSPWVVKS